MSRQSQLKELLATRIAILDGGMGTMLQRQNLTAADFGGEAYEGCNEHLLLTKPEAIRLITAASMAYAKRQNTWFGRYRNALLITLEKYEDYDPAAIADRILKA
mgnify:CR=1 FL=1